MERIDCSHARMESIKGLFAGVIKALIDQCLSSLLLRLSSNQLKHKELNQTSNSSDANF